MTDSQLLDNNIAGAVFSDYKNNIGDSKMLNNKLTSENEIADIVLKILTDITTGEAKLSYLRRRIPSLITLSETDTEQSLTRPREKLWEQRLRNIKSHAKSDGNYIARGLLTAPSRGRLRITLAGRAFVKP